MKYPWANTLILFLGALALIAGTLGLTNGSSGWVTALHVHRICGFAIVALLIWKGQNILLPLLKPRRRLRSLVPHALSLLLLSLLLSVLALGLAWSYAGPFYFMGFSGVSWHIYLSVAIIPIILWHTLSHRWSLRPRFWADRRSLLRTGGLAVAGLVLWRAGELTASVFNLPGADRRFTGSYERGIFSGNSFPTTSWINDKPKRVDPDRWTLKVSGLVECELALRYDELTKQTETITATLDCTGGWYSTQEWAGLRLRDVLGQAGVRKDAASVTVHSVTGYYRRFSLEEAEPYILATRVGGDPLSHRHGFPLRLVAPGKRGFDWVKWVDSIEVNDTSKWWQPPLPLT